MSRTEPAWMAGLRAAQAAPRCGAWAKGAGRPCRHLAMQNGRCYYHGGVNPGAPPNNTNGVSTGRYMREDAIAAKANTAIGKALRAMIKNAVTGYENRLPAAVVHAQHDALARQIATAEAVKEEARLSKAERLKAHDERLERHFQRLEGKHESEPGQPDQQDGGKPEQQDRGGPAQARKRKRAGHLRRDDHRSTSTRRPQMS
jgi:hypothetical protein